MASQTDRTAPYFPKTISASSSGRVARVSMVPGFEFFGKKPHGEGGQKDPQEQRHHSEKIVEGGLAIQEERELVKNQPSIKKKRTSTMYGMGELNDSLHSFLVNSHARAAFISSP
jgi:hypothetical protein